MDVNAYCALFRIFGLESIASVRSTSIAWRGLIWLWGRFHAAESCATNNDSRHPIADRSNEAFFVEGLKYGARRESMVLNCVRRRLADT